ncbi:hypothetical protein ACQPXS_24900 [Streptomyces sp. CA-142005]|uniref:hypothetical protein n=1 Tax=Streptomyces sp. CA-142005 TaxID=3240052 RepID=UPI003D8ECE5E
MSEVPRGVRTGERKAGRKLRVMPIAAMHPGFVRYDTVIVPAVALLLCLAMVVLSVFKPWGRRVTAPVREGLARTGA